MIPPRSTSPNRVLSRSRGWLVLGLLLLVLLVLADRAGLLLARAVDDMGALHGRAVVVVHVVSGDVIEVDAPDALHGRRSTQVRFWGVRAPQAPRPGREGQPYWEEAMRHTESLALGREVVLRLESHRTRDPQGALLAHVELPGGETLNEAMLKAGLAQRDERWPHAMLTPYAQAENRARRGGEGIWSEAQRRQ